MRREYKSQVTLDFVAGCSAIVVTLIATCAAIPIYVGQPWVLLGFGFASVALLIVGAASSRSVFCRLFSLFLYLGFFAKFIFYLFGAPLIEPVGGFSASPTGWDRVLLIVTAAFVATAFAIASCSRFFKFGRPTSDVETARFSRYLLVAFAISVAAFAGLFAFNSFYAVLSVGFVPRLSLPNYIYVPVTFLVSWGAVLWLAGIAYWLVQQGRWPVDVLFYIAAVEGAVAAVSMASRAQMVLHVLAVAAVYVIWCREPSWSITPRRWIVLAVVSSALFIVSIAATSQKRLDYLSGHPSVPSAALAKPEYDFTVPRRTFRNVLRTDSPELQRLLIMRWTGLEGVMAMSAVNGLGASLFIDVLKENPAVGYDAIYQVIAATHYERLNDFVFLTLPGPVALLLSSGSWIVVELGMMALVLFGCAIEAFALAWTRNPVMAGASGCALAFLSTNMNFPRTLLIFAIVLVTALTVIGALRKYTIRYI